MRFSDLLEEEPTAVSLHRVFVGPLGPSIEGDLEVTGEEAAHAVRVKRLRVGERVEAFDGAGTVAPGEVVSIRRGDRRRPDLLALGLEAPRQEPRVFPWLEVWSAVPKGDRLDRMVDQLSQVGVGAWAPLGCERSAAEGTAARRDRVERIVLESAKQCGRAWLMDVWAGGSVRDACEGTADGGEPGFSVRVLVADGRGRPFVASGASGGSGGAEAGTRIRLLVGPEGGWSEGEWETFERCGAELVSFGPHVLRVEAAAVVGAGVVMHGERVGCSA